MGKTPQIIASAYVGRGPRLDAQALEQIAASGRRRTRGFCASTCVIPAPSRRSARCWNRTGGLSEAELAQIAVGVCRRLQEIAGVGKAEIDVLNATRGGVLEVME